MLGRWLMLMKGVGCGRKNMSAARERDLTGLRMCNDMPLRSRRHEL